MKSVRSDSGSARVVASVNDYFYHMLLQDREIDAFELQQILSTATKKGIWLILNNYCNAYHTCQPY